MRTILLTVFLTTGCVIHAMAQEPGRILNDFEFMPTSVVKDPFAVTYFGSAAGGGLAFDLETPVIGPRGDTLQILTGNVAFLVMDFAYQQRFGSWFAARVAIEGSGRVGTNSQSLLAQGISSTYGINLGATARIYRSATFLISGAVDFVRSDVITVEGVSFTVGSPIVNKTNVIAGIAGARFGWAPAPWIGITGLVEGGIADVTNSENDMLIGGGGTVGFDLKNLNVIPLGVVFSFNSDAFSQFGADLTTRANSFGLGAFWTGWQTFAVGVEASMRMLERRGSEQGFRAFYLTANMRYWP